MARGGSRPGAGRPRGDRASAAYGYRPAARDIVRADLRGMTMSELIDEALACSALAEDRDPDSPPIVTIHRAFERAGRR